MIVHPGVVGIAACLTMNGAFGMPLGFVATGLADETWSFLPEDEVAVDAIEDSSPA